MKVLLLFMIYLNFNVFVVNGVFISHKTREKLHTQFVGLVKFILQMEEKKPIHEDVTFNLYTRYNPDEGIQLLLDQPESLLLSPFNMDLKTIFIIHGYTDHKERDVIIDLRRALLRNLMVNVIVVDWKRLAGLIYFNAASHVNSVGKYVARFMHFLERYGVKLEAIHLIGHSLGAQISGIAGRMLNGKVGRVTGLDPAGPLFEFIVIRNKSESLDHKDALFVDVIHTAGDDFGIMLPVGHVDFYPNGGTTPQPGCTNIITTISCSHIRSIEYFIESLNQNVPFLAQRCAKFTDKSLRHCNPHYIIPMGYFTPSSARGIYYIETNANPPFATGGKFRCCFRF